MVYLSNTGKNEWFSWASKNSHGQLAIQTMPMQRLRKLVTAPSAKTYSNFSFGPSMWLHWSAKRTISLTRTTQRSLPNPQLVELWLWSSEVNILDQFFFWFGKYHFNLHSFIGCLGFLNHQHSITLEFWSFSRASLKVTWYLHNFALEPRLR